MDWERIVAEDALASKDFRGVSHLEKGIRVLLDVSHFAVAPEQSLRCAFLSGRKFSLVKDVKKFIRKEVLKTEGKIQLFLRNRYWIPKTEPVQILQNDDLIVVRPCLKNSSKVTQFQTLSKSSSNTSLEKKINYERKLERSPSSASEESDSEMSTNDKGSKSENKQVTLDSKKQSDKCQKDGKKPLETSHPKVKSPALKRVAVDSSSDSELVTTAQEDENGTLLEQKKRKRKRQRKSKNKNKISTSEDKDPIMKLPNPIVFKEPDNVPAAQKSSLKLTTLGTNKKIIFEESEDANLNSLPIPQGALQDSSKTTPTYLVPSTKFLDPGSNNVTCEEAILKESNIVYSPTKKGRNLTNGSPLMSVQENGLFANIKAPIVIASRNRLEATKKPDEKFENVTYEDPKSYPMLKEPPEIGTHVAFKILTMSSNYTPGVSDFIYGIVVSTDGFRLFLRITHDDNKIEPRSGKFELDEEIEEETKIGQTFAYQWGDMIDPRHARPASQI